MYKATFELKAITPVFMRGADKKRAEIRAASLKGLLRWWFRALAGCYYGSDYDGLRAVESDVFGSTEKRSKITIEVQPSGEPKALITDVYKDKKNKIKPKFDKSSGLNELSYLWFSIKMQAEGYAKALGGKYHHIDGENMWYYPAGAKFRLTFKSLYEKSFILALASLWALVNLGGVGFRSRRGAGSLDCVLLVGSSQLDEKVEALAKRLFKWKEDEKENYPAASFYSFKSFEEIYKSHIESILKQTKGGKRGRSLAPVDVPYPALCNTEVWLSNEDFDDEQAALLRIQEVYAGGLSTKKRWEGGFRFEFKDDELSKQIKRSYNTFESDKERRPYFGLPLVYSNLNVQVHARDDRNEYERRASPLLFTVKKNRDDRYMVLMLILKSQYLPNHEGRFTVKPTKKDEQWTSSLALKKANKNFDNRDFIDFLEGLSELKVEIKKNNVKIWEKISELFNKEEFFT